MERGGLGKNLPSIVWINKMGNGTDKFSLFDRKDIKDNEF